MFGTKHDLDLLKEYTWEKAVSNDKLQRDMLALLYFFDMLMMRIVDGQPAIYGCSFSQRGQHSMLVVKALVDDIPRVAYVTERTPTGCVVSFSRMWLEDRVKWHKDKYAGS